MTEEMLDIPISHNAVHDWLLFMIGAGERALPRSLSAQIWPYRRA